MSAPETLDLRAAAAQVLEGCDPGDNDSADFDSGYFNGTMHLWEALTGLNGTEAIDYAAMVAGSDTPVTAAVVPF